MAIALVLSFTLIGLDWIGVRHLRDYETTLISSVDFSTVLMQGMLSLLLFAGALHTDVAELKAYWWQIGVLALVGTVVSALLIACALWYFLPLLGLGLPWRYCLMFGALISPTDPIAVVGILKSAGAPRSLEAVITSESLFNDGVGIVMFLLLLGMLTAGGVPTVGDAIVLLAREGIGGIAFGALLGYVTYRLLKSIDAYQEEVLLTLAAVMGGYMLATRIGVSGPLAMVTAGLVIGHRGRALAMSDKTRAHIDMFWELMDAILNSVLFVLIGMQVIVVAFPANVVVASAGAIAHSRWSRHRLQAGIRPAEGLVAGTDLGRAARRYLGRPGPRATGRTGAQSAAGDDLFGRRVFHSRPGTDDPRGRAHDRRLQTGTKCSSLSLFATHNLDRRRSDPCRASAPHVEAPL